MSNSQTVTVPARAWFGDDDRTLTFPAGWNIHICAGQGAPALDSTQIAAAISSPVAGIVFTIRFVIGRPGFRSLAMVGKRLRYQDQTAQVVYRL